MKTKSRLRDRAWKRFEGGREFVREYTSGLKGTELRRLFDRDAAEAYAVLTRDQEQAEPPRGELRRLVHQARLFFLGLSYKLTPERRLLFAGAMLATLLGLLGITFRYQRQGVSVVVDFSPAWFLLSVALLVFLLALELVDRIRVRDELEVARALQRELLPRTSPHLPGYRIAHSYRTANEVGGDYYDFPRLPDGRLVLMIGDASGHGMAAGLLMAIANATIQTALDLDPTPAGVVALLNRALCRTGGRRAFMTFFYGLLEPASGRLDYVCAGHPFPLLRRGDGPVEELGEGGLPLGLKPELEPPTRSVTLGRGDLLFLYTDGLAEGVNREGEAFGFGRLGELVRSGGGAQATHNNVLYAFDEHRGDAPLTDDVSLVVVEREAREVPEG